MIEIVEWQPWDRFINDFGRQFQWFWCDLDGAQVDKPLPADAPIATHLWGWAPGEWIRIRLDGDQVSGCRLVSPDLPDAANGFPWPETEGRVNIVHVGHAPDIAGLALRVGVDGFPITFLEVRRA